MKKLMRGPWNDAETEALPELPDVGPGMGQARDDAMAATAFARWHP